MAHARFASRIEFDSIRNPGILYVEIDFAPGFLDPGIPFQDPGIPGSSSIPGSRIPKARDQGRPGRHCPGGEGRSPPKKQKTKKYIFSFLFEGVLGMSTDILLY
jgi:hypothetical protein